MGLCRILQSNLLTLEINSLCWSCLVAFLGETLFGLRLERFTLKKYVLTVDKEEYNCTIKVCTTYSINKSEGGMLTPPKRRAEHY